MISRDTLIKNIDFKLRNSKINLFRLGITRFEELLNINYNRLEYLNDNVLMDIKTIVHNEGFLLLNEMATTLEKSDELIQYEYVTLEMLGFERSLYLFLYKNNIFTLSDLKNAYLSVFKLNSFGPVKHKYLEEALDKLEIDYSELEETKSESLINKLRYKNNINNRKDVDFSLIKLSEVSGIYIKLVDDLATAGIYTLADLLKYSYQELKQLIYLSDICLVELLNFMQSIGLEIKGYDQTNFRSKKQEQTNNSIKKIDVSDKSIEKSDILEVNKLNVEMKKRIDEKETLVSEYEYLMNEKMKLLEKEKEIDAKIDRILNSLKVKRYGKKR